MNDRSNAEAPPAYIEFDSTTPIDLRPLRIATALLVATEALVFVFSLLVVAAFSAGADWAFGPLANVIATLLFSIPFVWWCDRVLDVGRCFGGSTQLRTILIVAFVLGSFLSMTLRFAPLAFLVAQALVVAASFAVWSALWRLSEPASTSRTSVLIVLKTIAQAVVVVLSFVWWSSLPSDESLVFSLLGRLFVPLVHVALTIAVIVMIASKLSSSVGHRREA